MYPFHAFFTVGGIPGSGFTSPVFYSANWRAVFPNMVSYILHPNTFLLFLCKCYTHLPQVAPVQIKRYTSKCHFSWRKGSSVYSLILWLQCLSITFQQQFQSRSFGWRPASREGVAATGLGLTRLQFCLHPPHQMLEKTSERSHDHTSYRTAK